jgi:hypothetical protein
MTMLSESERSYGCPRLHAGTLAKSVRLGQGWLARAGSQMAGLDDRATRQLCGAEVAVRWLAA